MKVNVMFFFGGNPVGRFSSILFLTIDVSICDFRGSISSSKVAAPINNDDAIGLV